MSSFFLFSHSDNRSDEEKTFLKIGFGITVSYATIKCKKFIFSDKHPLSIKRPKIFKIF